MTAAWHRNQDQTARSRKVRQTESTEGIGTGADCIRCAAVSGSGRLLSCAGLWHSAPALWTGSQPQLGAGPRGTALRAGADFLRSADGDLESGCCLPAAAMAAAFRAVEAPQSGQWLVLHCAGAHGAGHAAGGLFTLAFGVNAFSLSTLMLFQGIRSPAPLCTPPAALPGAALLFCLTGCLYAWMMAGWFLHGTE